MSESALKVSESESKSVSESVLKVSELVSKLVSECPSLVTKLPFTWLLSSVAWLLFSPTWSLPLLTWLPLGLYALFTNSLVLSLLLNETFISSDKARSIPLPAPV